MPDAPGSELRIADGVLAFRSRVRLVTKTFLDGWEHRTGKLHEDLRLERCFGRAGGELDFRWFGASSRDVGPYDGRGYEQRCSDTNPSHTVEALPAGRAVHRSTPVTRISPPGSRPAAGC